MTVELARLAMEGNRRALARLLTMVENGGAEARAALRELFPRSGRAWMVGITGAPGTGKSTLVGAIARAYRRRGKTVGVIAVDPSSPFSGGAILADRIRMVELASDGGVFIRSMATRGQLGGLARATMDAARVLDACGYEILLIETVGVGQDEVDIAGAADTTLLLQVPGLGDDIQAVKAGVMEIGDIYVVNKADREGADGVARGLAALLSLGPHGNWVPPIVRTVATRGTGVDDLVDAIEQHHGFMESSGQARKLRVQRARKELLAAVQDEVMAYLVHESGVDVDGLALAVAERRADPYEASARLIEAALRNRQPSAGSPSRSSQQR